MRTPTKNVKILIIDDNPAIYSDFIEIFTTRESNNDIQLHTQQKIFGNEHPPPGLPAFRLVSATKGQEGIEKIQEAIAEEDPYTLVFVDIELSPKGDGIQTAKKIWHLDPTIQIVICTDYSNYTSEETLQKLEQQHNLLILKKPFDSISVRQLSWALIKQWQLLQESQDYTKLLEKQMAETHTLQESLRVTRGTLESSADGILVINESDTIIDYNQNLVSMFHIPAHLMTTKNAHLLFKEIAEQTKKAETFLKLTARLSNLKNDSKTISLKCQDERIIEVYTQPYKLENVIAGRIWCFRDITKRALVEEQLQHKATHDPLTKLPNRILLNDRLTQLISTSKRNGTIFCVLFFDLDRFKLINDSFSHFAGDKLLQDVVKRIRTAMREEDTLARLGGDEFIAILKSQDEKHVGKIAQKLLNIFHEPFLVDTAQIWITPSIGIATFPRDSHTVSELLRNADTAMYRAKEQGGNQFQFYTRSLGKSSIARLDLEEKLSKAIRNNELFLCFQPLLDFKTRKLISAEALVRWHHPEKGILLPIDFIPLAEETGLIIPLGEWVIREACRLNQYWQELGLPKIRIAVNIATKQLKHPNFSKTLQQILEETKLNPEYLEIEITENVILTNIDATATLQELKTLGIHITLDNFGSGQMMLNHLKAFPLDKIKIDQSYINKIHTNKTDEVIIQAIISLAKNLNLEVVAEGVESKEQQIFLEENQCTEAQGYLFCKPITSEEFEHFLKNTTTL